MTTLCRVLAVVPFAQSFHSKVVVGARRSLVPFSASSSDKNERGRHDREPEPHVPLPPLPDADPIIDHNGRAWHSNRWWASRNDDDGTSPPLRRDGLPYEPVVRDDGVAVLWRPDFGTTRDMLRVVGGCGRRPSYVDDDERWLYHYEKLVAYRAEHGHADARPSSSDDDDARLARWCNRQRHEFRRYRDAGYRAVAWVGRGTAKPRLRRAALISEWRIHKLREIGFDFTPRIVRWDERCRALRAFRGRQGHADVRRRHVRVGDVDEGLYWWVKGVRVMRNAMEKNDENEKDNEEEEDNDETFLTEERVAELDAIGFVWNPRDSSWDRRFRQLKRFKDKHGHCLVPLRRRSSSVGRSSVVVIDPLGRWVKRQRETRRRSPASYDPDRSAALNGLGFEWDPDEARWRGRLEELAASGASPASGTPLGIWTASQRKRAADGTLSPARAAALAAVLPWGRTAYEARWEARLAALTTFRADRGGAPIAHPADVRAADPRAADWLEEQRRSYGRGTLLPDRARRLEEALGFEWRGGRGRPRRNDAADASSSWEDRLAGLRALERDGRRLGDDPALRAWVNAQRVAYKKGTLDPARVAALDAAGFAWSVKDTLWEERLDELRAFAEEHGHCHVPRSQGALGRWVNNVRNRYGPLLAEGSERQTDATRERLRALERVGFEWHATKKTMPKATSQRVS